MSRISRQGFSKRRYNMPKKSYDIDILSILSSLTLERFTVSDITKHLLESHETIFNKKKNATQFVYRNLKSLEKKGIIKALKNTNTQATIFCFPVQNQDTGDKKIAARDYEHNHQLIVERLQEKIRLYKAEMLTSVGETEAYSEWVAEMPELAHDVKSHYQHTRDQAKLMLGKVKGFERLLAQYKAQTQT